MVMAIGGLLAVLGVPAYTQYTDRARVATTVADIKRLEMSLERFHTQNGRFPDSLAELDQGAMMDPWDQAYCYLHIAPSVVKGKVQGKAVGKARKDHNLVPINTDFDLYSIGKDGDTQASLVPQVSHDDVVRAGNGGYVGLAENY